MHASTKTLEKLPHPHIYEALTFGPVTLEGLHPYTRHLIAAFDHADAVARFRAEGLIGDETYVLTDEEWRTRGNVLTHDSDTSRIVPLTPDMYASWISVMLYEVRDGDKLVRGPTWVRVAP